MYIGNRGYMSHPEMGRIDGFSITEGGPPPVSVTGSPAMGASPPVRCSWCNSACCVYLLLCGGKYLLSDLRRMGEEQPANWEYNDFWTLLSMLRPATESDRQIAKSPKKLSPARYSCKHRLPGGGCYIYGKRPPMCRRYDLDTCDYLKYLSPIRNTLPLSPSPTTMSKSTTR